MPFKYTVYVLLMLMLLKKSARPVLACLPTSTYIMGLKAQLVNAMVERSGMKVMTLSMTIKFIFLTVAKRMISPRMNGVHVTKYTIMMVMTI